jgi:hypothetical protein
MKFRIDKNNHRIIVKRKGKKNFNQNMLIDEEVL